MDSKRLLKGSQQEKKKAKYHQSSSYQFVLKEFGQLELPVFKVLYAFDKTDVKKEEGIEQVAFSSSIGKNDLPA
jgi:hypothetical protein